MHLIKLLVTFEVKNLSEKNKESSTFYLVFPWAEGDLWHFWRKHDALEQRIPRCLWMAEQCFQLARALRCVHNERDIHLPKFLDVPENEHDLYGRHGDVKADNVLWYKRENDTLVIADFGLGRLHTRISRSNQTPKDLERSATYRAPEFDTEEGKISRACDIFSLGCMFLEFITWHLEGFKSVNKDFPEHRLEQDMYNFQSDTFFRIEKHPGNVRKPIIKPKIIEWIRRLKQNQYCSNYHVQFLDLIEKRMLHPNSGERIRSPELVRHLDLFATACRTDSSYYKDPVLSSQLPD